MDSTAWIVPPLAFLIVFCVYFGCFAIIFLGLVEGDIDVAGGSIILAVVTALAVLNLDIGESTIPISPQGDLLTGSLGWKSDLATLYLFFWRAVGVPKALLYFFVMFVSPAIVFTLIIGVILSSRQVREYWEELRS